MITTADGKPDAQRCDPATSRAFYRLGFLTSTAVSRTSRTVFVCVLDATGEEFTIVSVAFSRP